MLELEIQKLTVAIERLIAVLDNVPTKTIDPVPEAPAEPAPAPAPAPMTFVEEVETEERLQKRCLDIVRKDRTKRDQIKTLIAYYSGGKGKLVKDVPPNNWAEFANALEQLA